MTGNPHSGRYRLVAVDLDSSLQPNGALHEADGAALRAAHATDAFDDPAISPWYSRDRSGPVPVALPRLPDAR